MITEAKFKNALKEMISDTPLEEINVTTLCKKCNCHRQTFYYHYQDVYDLVSSIFLNEEIPTIEKAASLNDFFTGFLKYFEENFDFIKAISNSSAQDLVEGFIFSKVMKKTFDILENKNNEKIDVVRTTSRRFANFISKEFLFIFKDKDLTYLTLEKSIKGFLKNSVEVVLPAMVELGKKDI